MPDTKPPRKLSLRDTKQELIAAYNDLQKQLEERRNVEVKPDEKIKERAVKEAVEVADSLSTEEIAKQAGSLKAEVGRVLAQLSDRLESEIAKYKQVQKAVQAKDRELQEIFEIQRNATTLAALIEAQHSKRGEFETEMTAEKEELTREIESLREQLEKEKKLHEVEIKERDASESKRREREREEYRYTFAREQGQTRDQFEDQKARLEREVQFKREAMEREIVEREKVVAQKEADLESLHKRIDEFPKELESAVAKAIQETRERVQSDAKSKEELLKKEFAGERNVLTARIDALERKVAEQTDQIARLSQQLEKAYGQVQDIAFKAIEGSANSKSLASLQQLLTEQSRRAPQEK